MTDSPHQSSPKLPVCSRADATQDWWYDSDLEGQGASAKARNEDQLRAKLLCHDCPLLFECRRLGWDEPYHVFGGLTAKDRFRARKTGQIDEAGVGLTVPPPKDVVTNFVKGARTKDVAVSLNLQERTLISQLRAEVRRRRRQREGELPWGPPPPPALPDDMTFEEYRAGAALSEDLATLDMAS